MTYSKPEMNTLANAIAAVKSTIQDKNVLTFPDAHQGGVRNATPAAYEADE